MVKIKKAYWLVIIVIVMVITQNLFVYYYTTSIQQTSQTETNQAKIYVFSSDAGQKTLKLFPNGSYIKEFYPRLATYFQYIQRLYVKGEYLFVLSYKQDIISVMNISDINNIKIVANFSMGKYGARGIHDIAIRENTAYIVCFKNKYLYMLDIANISNIKLINKYNMNSFGLPNYIDMISRVNSTYLLATTMKPSTVVVLNVTDPNQIVHMSTVAAPNASHILIKEKYVYVSSIEKPLSIIDITNLSNPIIISNITNDNRYIKIIGDTLYTIVSNNGSLVVANISNPYDVQYLSIRDFWIRGSFDITDDGNYIVSEMQDEDGFKVIDISNQSDPVDTGLFLYGRGDPYYLRCIQNVTIINNTIFYSSIHDNSLVIAQLIRDENNKVVDLVHIESYAYRMTENGTWT